MAILKLEQLKKLIENLPDDYEIYYKNETTIHPVSSIVEIDTENKQLIFK